MRKPLLAGVAICLVLFGIMVTLVLPRPSRVTRANFERIKEGMTLAQVEEILGGPPGDYRTRPVLVFFTHWDFPPGLTPGVWYGDAGTGPDQRETHARNRD